MPFAFSLLLSFPIILRQRYPLALASSPYSPHWGALGLPTRRFEELQVCQRASRFFYASCQFGGEYKCAR